MRVGRYIIIVVFLVILCSACTYPGDESLTESVTPTEQADPTDYPEPSKNANVTDYPEPSKSANVTDCPEPTKSAGITTYPEPSTLPTPTPPPFNPYEGDDWVAKYGQDTSVRLSTEEIMAENEKRFATNNTGLIDLPKMTGIKGSELVAMIERYTLPSKRYLADREITTAQKNELVNARNLDSLKTSIASMEAEGMGNGLILEPGYGILIKNANLRSFPTELRLTSEVGGRFDYLQETILKINEPVLILHTSLDGAWCFVQAQNYNGWISADTIAYCSREQLLRVCEAIKSAESGLVAVIIKNGMYSVGGQQLALRMGTRFLCTGETETDVSILLPGKDEANRLVWESCKIAKKDQEGEVGVSFGYLPYTTANVICLSTSLLFTPYAWGDAPSYGTVSSEADHFGMDCSSTVTAVYECFGFVMPRNTGSQRALLTQGKELTGLSVAEKEALVRELSPGSLLYTSGHVMLYLGFYEDTCFVLHNTSTESRDDGGKDEFYRCIISTMLLGKSGQTIWERLVVAKSY